MSKPNLSSAKALKNHNKRNLSERFWIMMFLLPCLIFILVYSGAPIIITMVTAFCKWDGITTPVFDGLNNFRYIFYRDADFMISLINTLKWLVIQVVVQTILAIMAGFIMSREFRGWKVYRSLLMVPHIVPSAALATMFSYIFNPDIGLVNAILRLIGLEKWATNWLGFSDTAFWAVTSSWIFYCGLVGMLIYSSIVAIPDSQRESAMLDGCTKLQTDVYIVFPQLRNTIATSMIMSTTTAVGMFDFIYMMTNGGPGNATMNLPVLVFKMATSGAYGRAMAVCLIQATIGIVVISLINKFMIKDAD